MRDPGQVKPKPRHTYSDLLPLSRIGPGLAQHLPTLGASLLELRSAQSGFISRFRLLTNYGPEWDHNWALVLPGQFDIKLKLTN